MKTALLAVAAVLALSLQGCGGSYQCCNNNSYYECSSAEAANACATRNDYSNCTRNSQKDNACRPT